MNDIRSLVLAFEKKLKAFKSTISKLHQESHAQAAIYINSELLRLYYDFGKEIVTSPFKKIDKNILYYSLNEMAKKQFQNVVDLSPDNIERMALFYSLYNELISSFPLAVKILFAIPWGHHCYIIDKCRSCDEAIFFVHKTIVNNWSRNILLNKLDTDIFEREKAYYIDFNEHEFNICGDLLQNLLNDPYVCKFMITTKKNIKKVV